MRCATKLNFLGSKWELRPLAKKRLEVRRSDQDWAKVRCATESRGPRTFTYTKNLGLEKCRELMTGNNLFIFGVIMKKSGKFHNSLDLHLPVRREDMRLHLQREQYTLATFNKPGNVTRPIALSSCGRGPMLEKTGR